MKRILSLIAIMLIAILAVGCAGKSDGVAMAASSSPAELFAKAFPSGTDELFAKASPSLKLTGDFSKLAGKRFAGKGSQLVALEVNSDGLMACSWTWQGQQQQVVGGYIQQDLADGKIKLVTASGRVTMVFDLSKEEVAWTVNQTRDTTTANLVK